MIGRQTNEPPHFRVPVPGHCALPLGTRRGTKKKRRNTDTFDRRVENDGRNVDGSSAEEILNILFIERQAKLTQAPGVVVVVDRHGSSQCVPRQTWTRNGGGIGGVHRWNSTPCIRCRRKAVDVLERGQRHAVALLFMFMETGPFAEIAAGNYLA